MNSSPPSGTIGMLTHPWLMCCVIHTSTASPQSCPQWSLILKKSISPIPMKRHITGLFPALLRNTVSSDGGSTNLSADRSLPVSSTAHYTAPASSPQIPHWSWNILHKQPYTNVTMVFMICNTTVAVSLWAKQKYLPCSTKTG